MSIRSTRGLTVAAFTCFAASVGVSISHAQEYPNRPIRLIIPYPPGGPTDFVGRTVAQEMTKGLGQQVVVDNRAGAAAMIGHELGAKAAPDGYTLLFATGGGMVIAPLVAPKPAYDAAKDFSAISMLVISPQIIVAHPSLPANNIKELIAAAKAKPNFYNFASVGIGSPNHLGGELLKVMTGIDIVHVPYKGTSPAITDLIAGQTQFMFPSLFTALPHVRSGKLKALAVAGPKRSALFPDVPTLKELGIDIEYAVNRGLLAPKGTSAEVLGKLRSACATAAKDPGFEKTMKNFGTVVRYLDHKGYTAFLKKNDALNKQIAKELGLLKR